MTSPSNHPTAMTIDFAALRSAQGPGLQVAGSTERVLRLVSGSCGRSCE